MWYRFGADAVVALHLAYVSFIVIGQVAILLGSALKWRCVGNPWFRLGHLTAIAVVALEAVGGIACPLTVWEDHLRRLGGQEVVGDTFVGRLLHRILFYDFPPWVFTAGYVTFALLVVATLWWSPPRWPSRQPDRRRFAQQPGMKQA